jgi:hypothetical protein
MAKSGIDRRILSNQATSLDSQMIHSIQLLSGQTLVDQMIPFERDAR